MPKAKIKKGGKVKPPKGPEVAFRNELLSVINQINRLFRENVAPIIKQDNKPITDSVDVNDGVVGDITKQLASIQLLLQMQENRSAEVVMGYVQTVDRVNKARYSQVMKQAGFELSSLSSIASQEGITGAIEAATAENVALITRMGTDYLNKIQQAVLDNYLSGKFQGKGGLNKELQRIAGITRNRAKLIARDQTSKITGVMNQIRQQESGAIGYQWHNVNDIRVRGNPAGLYPNAKYSHWNREKKYYLWKAMSNPPLAPDGKPFRQPPPDGHPGIPIGCRCFASAVWVDDE